MSHQKFRSVSASVVGIMPRKAGSVGFVMRAKAGPDDVPTMAYSSPVSGEVQPQMSERKLAPVKANLLTPSSALVSCPRNSMFTVSGKGPRTDGIPRPLWCVRSCTRALCSGCSPPGLTGSAPDGRATATTSALVASPTSTRDLATPPRRRDACCMTSPLYITSDTKACAWSGRSRRPGPETCPETPLVRETDPPIGLARGRYSRTTADTPRRAPATRLTPDLHRATDPGTHAARGSLIAGTVGTLNRRSVPGDGRTDDAVLSRPSAATLVARI